MSSSSEVALSPSVIQRHEGLGIDYVKRPGGLPDLIKLTRRRLLLTPRPFATTKTHYTFCVLGHTVHIEVDREATPEAESLKQVELFAEELANFLRIKQQEVVQLGNEASHFEQLIAALGQGNAWIITSVFRFAHSVRNVFHFRSPFVKRYTQNHSNLLSDTLSIVQQSIQSVETLHQQLNNTGDDYSNSLQELLGKILADLNALSSSFACQIAAQSAIRNILGYNDSRSTL
ncbi:hypothetical protein IPJ72_05440 [Candidatus Peregrinibacteria bacterium]|nr:MAG: hypothetical protein IPJ72_05440 [Candidatus Peregrinibacteria bacterium]